MRGSIIDCHSPTYQTSFSYPREISHSIDHISSADAASVNGWSERGLATAVWVTPLSQAVYKIKRRMEPDVFVGYLLTYFRRGLKGLIRVDGAEVFVVACMAPVEGGRLDPL